MILQEQMNHSFLSYTNIKYDLAPLLWNTLSRREKCWMVMIRVILWEIRKSLSVKIYIYIYKKNTIIYVRKLLINLNLNCQICIKNISFN